jgi:hypothetical protein
MRTRPGPPAVATVSAYCPHRPGSARPQIPQSGGLRPPRPSRLAGWQPACRAPAPGSSGGRPSKRNPGAAPSPQRRGPGSAPRPPPGTWARRLASPRTAGTPPALRGGAPVDPARYRASAGARVRRRSMGRSRTGPKAMRGAAPGFGASPLAGRVITGSSRGTAPARAGRGTAARPRARGPRPARRRRRGPVRRRAARARPNGRERQATLGPAKARHTPDSGGRRMPPARYNENRGACL